MNFTGAQRSWRTGPKRRLSPNPLFKKEKAAARRMIGNSSGQSDPPKTGGQKAGESSGELKGNG